MRAQSNHGQEERFHRPKIRRLSPSSALFTRASTDLCGHVRRSHFGVTAVACRLVQMVDHVSCGKQPTPVSRSPSCALRLTRVRTCSHFLNEQELLRHRGLYTKLFICRSQRAKFAYTVLHACEGLSVATAGEYVGWGVCRRTRLAGVAPALLNRRVVAIAKKRARCGRCCGSDANQAKRYTGRGDDHGFGSRIEVSKCGYGVKRGAYSD